MNWRNLWRLALVSLVVAQGCKPEQIGFLNDSLRYNIAELQVMQGMAASTPPLIANGSSTPMTVELLEVRNKNTGAVVTEFLDTHDFHVFLAQVGADDNTLEQLNAKIGPDSAPALSVNDIGGKVTITPATQHVPPGLYTLDLQVTNISGTKVYKEALDINLLPIKPDSVFASATNTTPMLAESPATELRDFRVTTEYRATPENRIIYVWEDRDGKRFNPKKGEVIRRAALPSFADWSPYYPEVLTDTSIVYEYPFFKGMTYPLKSIARVGTTEFNAGPISHYRIPAMLNSMPVNSIALNINTSTTTRFYQPGTHVVRFKLTNVAWGLRQETVVLDVKLPEGAGYAATEVKLDSLGLSRILGAPAGSISAHLANQRATFSGVAPDGSLNHNSTAAHPGHWFGADGSIVNWGTDARLYCEFKPANLAFNIGQFPDRNFAGDNFVVRQSLIYRGSGDAVQVFFVFNITVE